MKKNYHTLVLAYLVIIGVPTALREFAERLTITDWLRDWFQSYQVSHMPDGTYNILVADLDREVKS